MTITYGCSKNKYLSTESIWNDSVPAVILPTILVPPIEVCTMGTTSPSSLSNAE
jgi:hypothetical protein